MVGEPLVYGLAALPRRTLRADDDLEVTMAKSPMKPARGGGAIMRSPLAPTNGQNQGSGLPLSRVDDGSAAEFKGRLRPKGNQGIGGPGSQAALGTKGNRTRSSTTAGSAQFRVTSKLPGPQSPPAQTTLANGRIMPTVAGLRQRANFAAGGATYGPMG